VFLIVAKRVSCIANEGLIKDEIIAKEFMYQNGQFYEPL